MSTDPAARLAKVALNGPTMGTRWSALLFAPEGFATRPLQAALEQAVDEVDAQMSTWKPQSDLMRLNAAPVGAWLPVPTRLMEVLRLGLEIGRASGGAFDIAMGDATTAWGFGPAEADPEAIRAALRGTRPPPHETLELDLDGLRARKHAPLALDLNGIAKGYGVDRLAETLDAFGIENALVGIDGELRALGLRPDGSGWTVAIEAPDPERRAPQSIVELEAAAIATSGDYRHWVDLGGQRLSHTMDPARGGPLAAPPASVTVVARSCAEADGWATALMVLGAEAGATMAAQLGLDTLFLLRAPGGGLDARGVGSIFAGAVAEPAAR